MWELDGNNNTVIKNTVGGVIIKTSDVSRVIVTTANTEIVNPLKISGGMVAPTAAVAYDISNTGLMVGYIYYWNSSTPPGVTFTSDMPYDIYTSEIPIGVWLVSGGHIFTQGTGTYSVASYTKMIMTINSGNGTLNVLDLQAPISNGSTSFNLSNYPITTGCLICQTPCIIKTTNTTVMTVGTAVRYTRLIFTRIA
jgi:hypothetical protein